MLLVAEFGLVLHRTDAASLILLILVVSSVIVRASVFILHGLLVVFSIRLRRLSEIAQKHVPRLQD